MKAIRFACLGLLALLLAACLPVTTDHPVGSTVGFKPDPALIATGLRVLKVPAVGEDRPELKTVVEALAAEGLSRLFVEGGGQVAASFIRCGLVDALEWFRAPVLIGGEGRPGIGALAVAALVEAPHFRRTEVREVGDDLWERYERA